MKIHVIRTLLLWLIVLVAYALPPPVWAEPQGGTITSGSAVIDQANPGTTNILQSTNKVIIDWQRFGIDVNELVRFIQPDALAVALNRITGVDPSVILGSLKANGRIFLVNPNGVVFGPTAQVDVGGLLATTLNISNEDFLSGNYRFAQVPGLAPGAVTNHGRITATDGGFIILVAPLVNNQGTIIANLGRVSLGATSEAVINFDGQNLVNFIVQSGKEPGNVLMDESACDDLLRRVVNNAGLVSAGSIVEEDGKVMLVGVEGVLVNSGTIAVNGSAGSDAGAIVLNSTQATVTAPTSVLDARGIGAGSDGGFVDTSSMGNLVCGGAIDTSSEMGRGGEWLIDPADVQIVAGGWGGSDGPTWESWAGNGTVTNGAIEHYINQDGGGTVTIRTTGTGGLATSPSEPAPPSR